MQTRALGPFTVSAIGLGEMPLSIDGRPSEADAVAVVHAALDAGVTLFDTADAYCRDDRDFGHGETLLAKALDGRPEDVVVATKGGHTRTADGGWEVDGRPSYLAEAARASLARLGGDAIDLYQHHRPDPDVPYQETIGALRTLVDEGIVRCAGISNADVDQIRAAHGILGDALVSVQNQFSPGFRSSRGELDLCAQLGIAFMPWSPLGGIGGTDTPGSGFGAVAEELDRAPQQVVLAWELALGEHVLPIPGSSRPETIRSSAAATEIVLTEAQLQDL